MTTRNAPTFATVMDAYRRAEGFSGAVNLVQRHIESQRNKVSPEAWNALLDLSDVLCAAALDNSSKARVLSDKLDAAERCRP